MIPDETSGANLSGILVLIGGDYYLAWSRSGLSSYRGRWTRNLENFDTISSEVQSLARSCHMGNGIDREQNIGFCLPH